jgi:aspartate/tyrosine/aromatic aminotransferase
LKEKRVASIQSLSGTGALRIAFDFVRQFVPGPVYVSNPTWGNHNSIINVAGLPLRTYPYWDQKTRGLNFEGMCQTFETAPAGSVLLLHSCAHNPTGCDPSEEQWKQIADICKRRGLVPFFDSAYQGFATGDFEKDAFSIRYFASQGLSMIITQSFAKNFGLYGERVGALHFVCANTDQAKRVLSQVEVIVRVAYSNPPKHGALIVDTIYRNPELYKEYLAELKTISNRIVETRKQLQDELERLAVPGSWSHITGQIGMFSFTGLSRNPYFNFSCSV